MHCWIHLKSDFMGAEFFSSARVSTYIYSKDPYRIHCLINFEFPHDSNFLSPGVSGSVFNNQYT